MALFQALWPNRTRAVPAVVHQLGHDVRGRGVPRVARWVSYTGKDGTSIGWVQGQYNEARPSNDSQGQYNEARLIILGGARLETFRRKVPETRKTVNSVKLVIFYYFISNLLLGP